MFDVYIKNGTYEDHKIKQEVKYFNFTGQNENQTVMNFQVTFFDPTVFAIKHLLVDTIYVHLKYELLDTKGEFNEEYKDFDGMFVTNTSRLFYAECN